MNPSGQTVAILHDDVEVAERVAALAAKAGFEVVTADSEAAVQSAMADPNLSAVILDLAGRRSGGFEALQRLCTTPSKARVIVVTSLDAKTVDSTQRLAEAKGFKFAVLRKDALDDQA